MAIPMQGSWTVSVKSKEVGATQQRFIISGAASGNGTYAGDTSTPAVAVTGDAWSVSVQHKVGASWVDSFDQIAFPTQSGGSYHFDIQANDDDVDPVFDDLILTCSTPVTFSDFLTYGNVSWYSGCFYNPCNPFPYFVIDSAAALKDALTRPALRASITALYPEKVHRGPNPIPDPPPFRPLVLPMAGQAPLPPRQAQVFQGAQADVQSGTTAKKAATRQPQNFARRTVNLPSAATSSTSALNPAVSLSASAIAGIRATFPFCQTGPLPQYLLRFQDYDRTPAELAGGPYTGTGTRTNLGTTTTDRNGNYIFRFTMSASDFLEEFFEVLSDPAVGEDFFAQLLPDVIVQVLDATAPSGVLYETAPTFHIPFLKRINVCVPRDLIHLPGGCVSGQIIQSIGNITVGPLVAGVRHTANTNLDANGVITSTSSLGPIVDCSAWAGSLYFYACLNQPGVTYYSLSFKKASAPDTSFQWVQEDYSPYHVAPAPIYWVQESVGPVVRFGGIPSYLNIETDTSHGPYYWMDRWKLLKVILSSSIYQNACGGAGPITFRIQGYDSTGAPVGGADDRITLYIDNNGVDQFIDPNLSMIIGGVKVTQGNCALFTVDKTQLNSPLEINFRSNQNEGFMNSYQLYMDKGAIGGFAIQSVVPPLPPPGWTPPPAKISDSYSGNCNFRGTSDEHLYDSVNNVLTADVGPVSGAWLDPHQIFCAFSINLSSSVRVTDGQGIFGPYYSGPILIGISSPDNT
jgi:hypothetical protein